MKPVKNYKLISAMPAIGIFLVVASFAAKRLGVDMAACAFMSGIGCAWVGIGVFGIFIKRLKPEYAKRQEIEQKDERNIQIRTKAGYVSHCMALVAMTALEFVFLVMDNDFACILTICAMTVHVMSFFAAMLYYNKIL
ncbi:MAG: hypothetical protein LBC69_00700 [Eubacteriaceae bacterium]|jgi:hypothetical protein|nr:hypothetical protein [Eubacteriaceae bacterium]